MINKFKNIFTTKKKINSSYLVDVHSHLIPSIDDGAKNMQESIELILKLKELGFKKLITTPHIMSHRFLNSSEIILSGLENLRSELKIREIDIDIEAAAEYYLDEHFMQLLQKRDILTFGDNYLLFESAYGIKPQNYESSIFEMNVAGYKPVLAHPERYLFMHRDFSIYEKLKEQGVYFQINLNSLSGYYSKSVQKVAYRLVEKGWIDFIGSDTHHQKHLEYFKKNLDSSVIDKIFKKNTILNEQLL